MKLSIIIGVLNQHELAATMLRLLIENMAHPEWAEVIVIDNGSDVPFVADARLLERIASMRVVRNEVNTGNYPLFEQGCKLAQHEIVAFLHSDVFVHQKGWDDAVLTQFESRPALGLLGFIGSTELDSNGGRGMGTVSNMQGRTVDRWTGSAAHIHGRESAGMTVDGSVVDGCVMIFRKSVLEKLERKVIPPHHFYDRILSCQVIEHGHRVGILGVEFDHVSGQTANHESKWQDTSKEWFRRHMSIETPQQWAEVRKEWVNNARNPSANKVPDQWDYCAYLEAEYRFLNEFRDTKRIVPMVYGRRI